ncbi:hypothetical protein [Oceanidesulfovibrio indonesiensis]|nr:hypothetical protein [Oceanidesulfovibrio indonesiensis]
MYLLIHLSARDLETIFNYSVLLVMRSDPLDQAHAVAGVEYDADEER